MTYKPLFAAFAALMTLGACQHSMAAQPATLADGSDANLEALKVHLADAMGVAKVTLGADDPTQSSTISVLPPPLGALETRSPVKPTVFQLYLSGTDCFAVETETNNRIELPTMRCTPK